MLLRPEQMEKIGQEIHLREMRCPNCKGATLVVDHRVFEVKQASSALGSVGPSLSDGLTLVVVECEECQRVQLFDAGALGVAVS